MRASQNDDIETEVSQPKKITSAEVSQTKQITSAKDNQPRQVQRPLIGVTNKKPRIESTASSSTSNIQTQTSNSIDLFSQKQLDEFSRSAKSSKSQ